MQTNQANRRRNRKVMLLMTVNNLKKIFYSRTKAYWENATVAWGNTKKVKPNAPLVILRLGTVSRAVQPITQMINGIVFSAYPSDVPIQIDLFTKGQTVNVEFDEYSENTALNDLLDFVNFMDSVSTIEWSNKNNISVSLLNGVRDLSDVLNGNQWQYRAMCELQVAFTQWAAEYHGILNEASIIFEKGLPVDVIRENWKQTASGGGTKTLADESTGFFEEVITEYMEETKNVT